MIYHSQRAISALNDLIETCKDAERAFRTAAEGVAEHPELRLLLHAYALECAQFAAELQSEVRRIGGHPEDAGSVLGAVHRGWRQIKAAVAGRDQSTILSECEAEEDAAVKAYDAALTAELGPKQWDIVARQRADLKRAHEKIRVLKGASRAAFRAGADQ